VKRLYLSPSKVANYEACGKKYQYESVYGWKPQARSATLEFGSAIHAGAEVMLKANALGRRESPVDPFIAAWRAATATMELKYSSGWDAASMENTGTTMLRGFEQAWYEHGGQVMLDPKGVPLVEREMTIDCGENIHLRMKMDLVYVDADGEIVVADLKSPRAESPEDFAFAADQVVAYQMGVESTPEFGIERIDAVQFIELLKLKTKARTSFETRAPRRPDEQVQEYLKKVRHVARDIREEYFPRRAGMAYNTPCSMCEMKSHCFFGNFDGIDIASVKETYKRLAQLAA